MKRQNILKTAQQEVISELSTVRQELASELVVKGISQQERLARRLEKAMKIERG